jgi:hypothetical protein
MPSIFFPAKTAGLIEDSLFVPKQPKQYSFFKDLFPVNLLTSYRWTINSVLRCNTLMPVNFS